MKRISMLMAVALCTVASLSFSQTKSTQTSKSSQAQSSKAGAITDEDLRKYAITLDSVQGMQQTLQQIIAENVQKNTVMEVQRYNQLFKIEKDEAQLSAANATAEEKAFLKEIADLRDYNVKRINDAYQALAKDYVGVKTFNAIEKSLEADAQLKARYEAIAQEIKNGTGETASNRTQQ